MMFRKQKNPYEQLLFQKKHTPRELTPEQLRVVLRDGALLVMAEDRTPRRQAAGDFIVAMYQELDRFIELEPRDRELIHANSDSYQRAEFPVVSALNSEMPCSVMNVLKSAEVAVCQPFGEAFQDLDEVQTELRKGVSLAKQSLGRAYVARLALDAHPENL